MGKYKDIGAEIGALVEEKQVAYGDSFSKAGAILRILYPDGVPLEKLDDMLTIARIVDKLFRIATDRDALGESPWRDIAGYALLSVARVEGRPEAIKAKADAEMLDLLNQLTAASKPKVAENIKVTHGPETCGDVYEGWNGKLHADTPCVLGQGHSDPHEDRDGMQWNTQYDHDYGEW